MDVERWRRLDELFQEALDRPVKDRGAFLEENCPDDPELRREVAAMLAADAAEAGSSEGADEGQRAMAQGDERLAGIVRAGIDGVVETRSLQAAKGKLGGDLDEAHHGDDTGPLPFESLGPYRLIKELGRGGLSTVYLAERDDKQFTMQVAVKLVKRGLDSPGLLERLRLERQILARLKHPNIAGLIDGGTAPDGRPYFVMERIEGDRIDRWCKHRNLDLQSRLELFRQLCDAVQSAHNRLVLHRDIKPSNILVTQEGIPKLLDFGIAKLLDGSEDAAATLASGFSTLTDTGMKLLTPEFASPEQVRGEALTTASDVYSLGVLLYVLVTGDPPYTFDRRRPAEVERVVCEIEPPRPSSVVWGREREEKGKKKGKPSRWSLGWPRGAGGDDLDTIVHKALHKESERRYGSVARLARDLRNYQQDLPISARPDTLRYRTGKFIRRHRGPVLAAVLLVLVLLAGIVTTSWQARQARLAQQRAEEQKALADQRQEQAERERRRAEEATVFLVDLFEMSDPFRTEGEQQEINARQLLSRGAERLGSRLGDDPLLRATLMSTIGQVYQNLALLDESEELLAQALELRQATPGAGVHEVLESRQALANLRIDQERYREAEEILQAVVSERRERGDETSLATALEDLAVAKRALDAAPDAEVLLEEALALHFAGRDELAVAQTRNTLAQLRRRQGDFETAGGMFREVLEVRRRHLGEDHPLVALSLNDLGLTLKSAGRFEQAEELFREVLSSYRRIFGQRHHHVVSANHNLASVLVDQRKVEEALQLYDQNEALVMDLYGGNHPAMARVLHSRALVHRVLGEPAKAIPWARRAWAINAAYFGQDHSSTLRDANQLADLLVKTGDPQAEAFLLELIADLRRVLEPTDVRLSFPLLRLGALRLTEGDAQGAETLLREAVKIRREGWPAGHWTTAQAEGQLGRCLTQLRRFDEGEHLLRSSYGVLRKQYEEKHPQVQAVKGYLADLEKARATTR